MLEKPSLMLLIHWASIPYCGRNIRTAIRIRNPHVWGLDIMQERPSLVLLIHWASIPYISLVLGRGVIWVEAGGLPDFLFFPASSLLFFFVSPIFTGVILSPIFTGIIFSPGKAGRDFFRYSNIQVTVATCNK